jgi:peptidyl-prolyl cis-trans isomerase C
MRKTPIALILGALLAAGSCLAEDAKPAAAPAGAASAPAAPVVIATVNGVAYPLDQFRMFYMERLQETKSENVPEFQQQAFNEFMSLIVASQEAERRKLGDNPDVQAALALQRLKVMSNAALASMAQEVKVTDEELKAAYEQVKKASDRTEYKARHILVKDEAEAKKLIKELEKKADFAELAKKHSLGPTGKNGGELDWFDASQMVKPFVDAVAAMKPGAYSKEPVQTQFGWHIIELQDTRKAEPPAFEDAKPQLTNMVQRQQLAGQLGELRNKAMVELNEEVVKVKAKDEAAEAAPAAKEPEKKDAAKKDAPKK